MNHLFSHSSGVCFSFLKEVFAAATLVVSLRAAALVVSSSCPLTAEGGGLK